MINFFKDDFHLMLREHNGYFPWVEKHPYRLDRLIYGERHCPCDRERNGRKLIRQILTSKVCENSLLDLLYKALIRAEIRFISRYVPQKSHEERLTGSLVSEISNSIELIKQLFIQASIEEYGVEKNIDFIYYDLSRGGKLESETGADLAFAIAIDIPDYPKVYKSYVFQAKKINGSSQIGIDQFNKIKENFNDYSAYLFYDMNFKSFNSPFVLSTGDYTFSEEAKKAIEAKNKSFSIKIEDVHDGLPLSSFLVFNLIEEIKSGYSHYSFSDIVDNYLHSRNRMKYNFNGRLAIMSIGRKINHSINNDGGFVITDE